MRRSIVVGVLAMPMLQPAARAQGMAASAFSEWPACMILPFSTGGRSEIVARVMRPRTSETLGHEQLLSKRSAGYVGPHGATADDAVRAAGGVA